MTSGKPGAAGEDVRLGVVRPAGFGLHPLVLVFALSDPPMISRIRIPKP